MAASAMARQQQVAISGSSSGAIGSRQGRERLRGHALDVARASGGQHQAQRARARRRLWGDGECDRGRCAQGWARVRAASCGERGSSNTRTNARAVATETESSDTKHARTRTREPERARGWWLRQQIEGAMKGDGRGSLRGRSWTCSEPGGGARGGDRRRWRHGHGGEEDGCDERTRMPRSIRRT